jgi:hypothetical protein
MLPLSLQCNLTQMLVDALCDAAYVRSFNTWLTTYNKKKTSQGPLRHLFRVRQVWPFLTTHL